MTGRLSTHRRSRSRECLPLPHLQQNPRDHSYGLPTGSYHIRLSHRRPRRRSRVSERKGEGEEEGDEHGRIGYGCGYGGSFCELCFVSLFMMRE